MKFAGHTCFRPQIIAKLTSLISWIEGVGMIPQKVKIFTLEDLHLMRSLGCMSLQYEELWGSDFPGHLQTNML